VSAGADAEVDPRLGHPQVIEEDPGHVLVVVLPGVQQRLLDAALFEAAHQGRHLHEVG